VGCALLSHHLAGLTQIGVGCAAAVGVGIGLDIVVRSYGAMDISPDQQLRALLKLATRDPRKLVKRWGTGVP
jgi:hypothetical protein